MTRHDYVRIARLIAQILDRRFRVPGTDIRIGLDPLIGLIPGVGDALAGLIGSTILFLAAQLQVPKIVLVRMTVNIVMNGVIGAIPLVGDLFSVWFHSNVRNAGLLERHVSDARASTLWDWGFVIGLALVILVSFAGMILLIAWLIKIVWQGIS